MIIHGQFFRRRFQYLHIRCVRSIRSTGMAAAHNPSCHMSQQLFDYLVKTMYNVITSSGYRLKALSEV